MASQKQYSIDFILNAVMNGGFSGVFNKAQQEFVRLGNEIKQLQAIQRDISAYQKQEQAVKNTSEKLENLKRQYELVCKQIEETKGSTTGLEREKLKLEMRIQSTQTALEKQRDKLEATRQKLEEAGVSTTDLDAKIAELNQEIQRLTREQEEAAKSATDFKDAGVDAANELAEALTAAGITVALKEIADGFITCVKTSGDFYQSMSAVEAIAEASEQQMGALTDKAKELGASTVYTAQQSADAMGFMAMAGWNANEMLEGMTGVTNLAAAAGEDLAQVSDIVTDSLTAFGLKASDTAHFADVLAAAAANSNTNISIMGDTFKRAAPVAGALGYKIEDVAIMVGLMANAGVKGSRAGTTLSNIFNGLIQGVTLTGEKLGEYEFTAMRTDGTMKGLTETVDELRGCFSQMSEAEKVANAREIAGLRGYAGLLAIVNATTDDYDELSEKIYNCAGAAERMAQVKLDNLNGDLTIMKSAWEALKITIGEQFTPELRKGTVALTDMINGVNQFVKAHPAFVKGLTVTAGGIGAVTAALTGFAAIKKVVSVLDLGTLLAGPAGAIAGVAAALAGVAGLVTILGEEMQQAAPEAYELRDAVAELQDTLSDTSAQDAINKAMARSDVANDYIDRIEQMGDATSLSAEKNLEYQNTLALLLQVAPELSDSISQTTDEYGRVTYAVEGNTDALRDNIEAMKEQAITAAYQDRLTEASKKYADVMVGIRDAEIAQQREQDKYDATLQRKNDLIARQAQLWAEAKAQKDKIDKDKGPGLVKVSDFLDPEYYSIKRELEGIDDELFVSQRAINDYQDAIDQGNNSLAGAKQELEDLQGEVRSLAGAEEEGTKATEDYASQNDELQGILDGTMQKMEELAKAYNDAYNAALSSIEGQYDIWDEAAKVVPTKIDTINKALQGQTQYWKDYNDNLAIISQYTDEIDGLDQVISSFADGSEESVNAVAGIANAIKQGDVDKVAAMVKNWKDLKEEQQSTADTIAQLQVDLDAAMQELIGQMEDDVEQLDMKDDARQAAANTVEAYISQINDPSNVTRVQYAWAKIIRAAKDAVNTQISVGKITTGTGYDNRGYPSSHYASGTNNAAPGWAEVGENGPELVFFHGGETVLNAAETATMNARMQPVYAQLATGAGGDNNVQVVFQIEGNATPETVTVLQEYGDDFADRVLEVIEEAAIDARRRDYR